ncbi:MAG TPA: tetratricopeptide repeat protein [Phycisphaerae bacterium]|nr:tetratricopeptide repeat protein [Phycisphaerae bacterium]
MRKILGFLAFLLAISVWPTLVHAQTTTAPDYDALEQAALKGNSQALAQLQAGANSGNTNAEDGLGLYYSSNTQYANAFYWYQKAAEHGNVDGEFHLAYSYQFSEGTAMNSQEAIIWYQIAAAQGNTDAEVEIGIMYSMGWGVVLNNQQAVTWYQRAAALGNPDAMFLLGENYEFGEGVPKDYSKARAWYKKAAQLGNQEAQKALADLSTQQQPQKSH